MSLQHLHTRLINNIKRRACLHLRIKYPCHPLLIYTLLSLVQMKKWSAHNGKTNPEVRTAACATSDEAAKRENPGTTHSYKAQKAELAGTAGPRGLSGQRNQY